MKGNRYMKTLPFTTNVPIISYVHHAYPLGIISAHENDYDNYLLYTYSQLVWYDHFGNYNGYELNFDVTFFKFSEAFNREYLDNDILKALGISDFIEYIISCINNNRYIYLCVDYYYLPQTDSYLLNHNNHDLLIYGYNKDSFLCAGYNKSKKYTKLIFPFNLFRQSNPTYVELLSYNSIKNDYPLVLIRNCIHNYLYTDSELESLKYNDSRFYGEVATAKVVSYMLQSLNNDENINIIPLCILREYFRLMNKRIMLISEFDINILNSLNETIDTIVNLTLKYNLTKKRYI